MNGLTEVTATDRPRVIDLEDAATWLRDASASYAAGDVAAAVFATHVAIGKATEALDTLMYKLPYAEEANELTALD